MTINPPDLEELQKKIAATRVRDTWVESRRGQNAGAKLAINMTAELIATMATGGFLGYMLDRWVGSAPLFFISGLLLGAVAGLIAIKRINDAHAKRMEKSDMDAQETLDK